MNTSLDRPSEWHVAGVSGGVFIAALVLYIVTATPTITARHGGADGGELAAVALSGGVAHPPGYPTYLVLARVALRVPWGEPAARLAMLSACCGAAAAATTAALAMLCCYRDRASWWSAALAGGYAGLVLAGSARFWAQAIIAEVYALHMVWLALVALLVLRWLHTAHSGLLVAAALCLGLGLGTHLTLLVVVPAALVAWWAADPHPRVGGRVLGAALAASALGASVYALLPLWSVREAVPSWGDQHTLAGWWAHVSSAEYRYLVGRVPLEQQLNRLGFATRDLVTQLGPVALGLGLWGLPGSWRMFRPAMLFTGCVAACSLVFAVSYGGTDGEVYLLPWIWAWCVWAGLGIASIFESLRAARAVRWLAGSALIASAIVPIVLGYPRVTLHGDTSERNRVVEQVQALPPNALLLTNNDADTFGVWYVQRALDVRGDVLVIDARLAWRAWYQAQVVHQLGAQGALCQALHATSSPTFAWHDQGVQPVGEVAWRAALGCDD